MLLEGKARGGPRDGVKLSAQPSWDGKVVRSSTNNSKTYYPGHYYWDYEVTAWVWVAVKRNPSGSKHQLDTLR